MFDSRSYVTKKSRRLAMLPEEIQRLVDTTQQQQRGIIQVFEKALHVPEGYFRNLSKSNDE